jgi:hypothetical protein
MVAVLAGGSGPGGTRFEGGWTTTDTDGSTETLIISAGRTPTVHFVDEFASGCLDHGDTSTRFLADGVGQIQVARLDVYFPDGGCVTWHVGSYYFFYDYQDSTDTLLDAQGISWHRLR